MVGTIVSLALSAAGAVASAIGSKKANDKQQTTLDNSRAQSNAFYDSEIFQDPTKRSDNQAYLKLLDSKLKRANEIADSKNKILGATHEQSLAQNQNAANAYSNAITSMAAKTSQRRDALLKNKRAATVGYENQQANIDASRMQNWANLASNAANLGASAIKGFEGGTAGTAGSTTKEDANTDARVDAAYAKDARLTRRINNGYGSNINRATEEQKIQWANEEGDESPYID